MRGPAGRCPNCNAPIKFRWSSAVQTICESCRSVVVRHDVDLEAMGKVSDLPPDSSPILLGTEGRFDNRAFTVTGRIVYEYEDGGWNEWHLEFADGSSGWLSDAQAEYAVSTLVKPPGPLPSEKNISLGYQYPWDPPLQVTTLTRARYVGIEGDLPFETWDRHDVLFADLRGHEATFGTIDYSETPALLFIGRFLDYDDLSLRHVRTYEGW